MEKDKKELNLTDVFTALWRGIANCFKACCYIIIWCLRYLYRHKWATLFFLVAGIVAGLGHYKYRDPYRSGFLLNIPAIMPCYGVEYVNSLQKNIDSESLAEFLPISEEDASKLKKVKAYYVVDCGQDGNIDFVDYKSKYGSDTIINTWSRNRFQVEVYTKDEKCVPVIKDAIVKKMCSLPVFADSWEICRKEYEERIRVFRSALLTIDTVEQKLYSMDNHAPSFYSMSTYDRREYFSENRVQIFSQDRQYLLDRIGWAERHYHDELSMGPISSTMPILYFDKDKSLPLCIIGSVILSLFVCILLCLLIENRRKIIDFLEDKQTI